MKTCSCCKAGKQTSEFYASKKASDGLKSQCKPCHIEGNIRTRNQDTKRDTNRIHMHSARIKQPDKFRAREREASKVRPKNEKTKARDLLNGAVRSGQILRPAACSSCGLDRKVTAHHADYSKPLDVQWLCYECHGKEHRHE